MSICKSENGTGVDLCVSWINASNGEIPPNAIHIGDDRYVARSEHEGEIIPGKVATGFNDCSVPYGGEECLHRDYQVLCDTCMHSLPGNSYEWVPWSGDRAPKYGVIAGTDGGKPLFVAKGQVEGEWCAGKYMPAYGKAYFPYGGEEHEMEDGFEVLVMCKRSI